MCNFPEWSCKCVNFSETKFCVTLAHHFSWLLSNLHGGLEWLSHTISVDYSPSFMVVSSDSRTPFQLTTLHPSWWSQVTLAHHFSWLLSVLHGGLEWLSPTITVNYSPFFMVVSSDSLTPFQLTTLHPSWWSWVTLAHHFSWLLSILHGGLEWLSHTISVNYSPSF